MELHFFRRNCRALIGAVQVYTHLHGTRELATPLCLSQFQVKLNVQQGPAEAHCNCISSSVILRYQAQLCLMIELWYHKFSTYIGRNEG